MSVQVFLPYVQLAVSLCTLVGLLYAFYKFTRKPQDSLEERVSLLERRMDKVESASNENASNIDKVTSAITALVDFELAYCITTHYESEGISDLKHAKAVLRGEADY